MSTLYEFLPRDYYETSLNSINPIIKYYHTTRYHNIREFISKKYASGAKILDMGCGTSSWNKEKIPVTGIDMNDQMLQYAKEIGTITETVLWDLTEHPLPFKTGTFDFVVLSEVLEHLDEPSKVLMEIKRILKENGNLIITVPLDTSPGVWWFFYGFKCLVLGDILGDKYYQKRGGHIQHFSYDSLSKVLSQAGFSILAKNVNLMNISVSARKNDLE